MPHNTKAKIKAYKKAWYKKNKERILNQQKEYRSKPGVKQDIYARRKEKMLSYLKEYYKKKKEKEFKKLLVSMRYERSEARKEKKRINQQNYMLRKKLKRAA